MRKEYKRNKGFTLVEIIVSLALLGILAVTFIPLFTMSATVMGKTQDKLEATYTGKDTMELMYKLSLGTNYNDLETELVSRGYDKDINNVYIYQTTNNKCIELGVTKQEDLVEVVTKVYSTMNRTELESKYQAYYKWANKGDANEG